MELYDNTKPRGPEGRALLCTRWLPARLDAQETGVFLGFKDYEIGSLVSLGLLKPLGKPALHAPKAFALPYIMALRRDTEWLDKATRALQELNLKKNQRQRQSRRP